MNEPNVSKDTQVVVLAQGREVKSGEWWTLSRSDREGHRTAWWAENATPGVFTEFRTVEHKIERIVTTTVLDAPQPDGFPASLADMGVVAGPDGEPP